MSDVGTSKNKIKIEPDNLDICYMGIPIGKIRAVKSGYRSSISLYDENGITISDLKSTKVRYNKEDGCYVRITDNGETSKSKPVSKQKIDYYLKELKQKTKNKEDNDITKE